MTSDTAWGALVWLADWIVLGGVVLLGAGWVALAWWAGKKLAAGVVRHDVHTEGSMADPQANDTPTLQARRRWPQSRLIMDRAGESLYLTRYFLAGHRKSAVALMLHRMHRPDDDECHHDHPWGFLTLILRGGYIEEVTLSDGSVRVRNNRPGMLLWRPATHTHRIRELPTGSCWTLVLRFGRRREWGFHTREGWVPWRRFIELRNAVAWCEGWFRKREREDEEG